ncbi:MAG: metal-dependent hydrolase [Anaerolineae bacterium]|jgi:membrane-bound metal-dependent hydrolase YbcI (DUF457 family)
MLADFVSTIPVWVILGLLAGSVVVTLVANWLVVRLNPRFQRRKLSLGRVVAELIWMLLVFAAGLVVFRYLERLGGLGAGFVLFGLLAFALSVGRAHLYARSAADSGTGWRWNAESWQNLLLPGLSYLFAATILYFLLSWLLNSRVQLGLLLPLYVGALLPDLDSPDSLLGRLFPFLSRPLAARFGPGQVWHTPAAAGLIALVTSPLILWTSVEAWALIILGYASHLLLDLLRPEGIMLLWPLRHTRYAILGGALGSAPGWAQGRLVLLLAAGAALLLLVIQVGPEPPPPAPTLTYQESLDRYQAVRGRSLVFSDVEGTWQATGRRVADRFEILNAQGESFVLLDRYTGRVFTAGRSGEDNLYAHRLSVVTGAPADIKAIEVQLEDQQVAEALPVLYQMQQEPGLEHIFVSGDVVLANAEEGNLALRPDYAQTRLRKIRLEAPGHYTLHYLTAAELIELAAVPAASADLVIVATYLTVPSGPTPTALPTAPLGETP